MVFYSSCILTSKDCNYSANLLISTAQFLRLFPPHTENLFINYVTLLIKTTTITVITKALINTLCMYSLNF